MELALAAARFVIEFPKANVVPEMTDEDMFLENYSLIAPKSHKRMAVL